MSHLCAMVPSRSIANDQVQCKNKIHIQITASCMVQEAAHMALKKHHLKAWIKKQ